MKASVAAKILLWCALCVLVILGFGEANAISRFNRASLRYTTPISGQAAYRARLHSIANAEQDTFWPTFWHESKVNLSVGTRDAQSNAILFSGDAGLVWPAEFIAGSAPSVIDARGVAVSEPLAYRLWGSTNIIGMPVHTNEEPRIVRGVFAGAAELVLISFHIEDTSQIWTAVELAGGPPHPTRNNAEQFAMASGLGKPDYVQMGGAVALARLMAFFPIFIHAAYGLVLTIRFIRKYYRVATTPVIFAGLILSALMLPFLLNALPPWLIPTHWSDFSFWGQLYRQGSHSLREFLSAPPMLKDVEIKIHLLRQIGISFFAICCSIGCMNITTGNLASSAIPDRMEAGDTADILSARRAQRL